MVDSSLGLSGSDAYVIVGDIVPAEAAVFAGTVLPGETALAVAFAVALVHQRRRRRASALEEPLESVGGR